MRVFHDFHAKNKFEKGLNATFIVFIPKKFGAGDVKEFWRISPMSGVYEVIAKILANRLRMVLEKII